MGLCFGKKNAGDKGTANTKASANSGETTKSEKEPAKNKTAAADNKDSKNVKKIEGAEEGNIRDKYIIGDELGRGGFSIVYKAVRRSDSAQVAVKIVQKTLIREDIKLLKREIEIMKTVNHPNILKLIEIYEDAENVYIVMELVDGNELFDRIVDRGYYSEKSTVHIVKQILEAIRYLHEHNIAHRDLKPENLLCSGEGSNEVVKIADFGLSKIFAGANGEPLQTSCGTPGYVAPEVLTSDSYDEAVDMWGVGIITYILLAGYPPFYADDDTQLFEKIMSVEYDFDDECWDDVSDLAKNFIQQLLVQDPKRRLTAEDALKHKWLTSSAADKALNIHHTMYKYNFQRKDQQKRLFSDDNDIESHSDVSGSDEEPSE
jgi:calcium/calmodulin-dependent protein kinase I